jgi:hypothetical protein
MELIDVLVDDQRDLGYSVIIRHPDCAKRVLDMISRSYRINKLGMDNDMGGFIEGRQILEQFLETCRTINAGTTHNPYPRVVEIVTSNPPARMYMEGTLRQHGYSQAINSPQLWFYEGDSR